MKREYSLFESVTKHGVWWFPSRPEDRVRGDLVFDGSNTKLKLFGAFEGTESVFVDRDAEIILGSCGDEDITLLNCRLGERWDVMRDSITSTWWCQFALIGLHAVGGLEHGFTQAEVRFTGLEYWIAGNGSQKGSQRGSQKESFGSQKGSHLGQVNLVFNFLLN